MREQERAAMTLLRLKGMSVAATVEGAAILEKIKRARALDDVIAA